MSSSPRPGSNQPQGLTADGVRDVSVLTKGVEVSQLKPGKNVHCIRDRRSWIAGKVVYHLVASRPLPVNGDLSEQVLADAAHCSDQFYLMLGYSWVGHHGMRDEPVRIADQDVPGLAVALHRQAHTIFHSHLHDAVDDGYPFRWKIDVLSGHVTDDLVDYRFTFFRGLFIDLLKKLEPEPGIIGL